MPVQKWSDRIWVAKLASDPILTEDLRYLCEHAVAGAPMPDLVLDLSQVDDIQSKHLSAMLRLREHAVRRDARLRVVGPTDQVWAVFLTTGLDKVFTFVQDTSTALAQLQIDG